MKDPAIIDRPGDTRDHLWNRIHEITIGHTTTVRGCVLTK